MIGLVEHCPPQIPLQRACDALSLNRSTVYARRHQSAEDKTSRRSRRDAPQPRALSAEERRSVTDTLNSEEFQDQPPRAVYFKLLERGTCLCSPSTMYRLLRKAGQIGERRPQREAQHHAVPRLKATAPNQVWTWDNAKLATTTPGEYLTLYTVLDLYSRYVLAWMISRKENSALAVQLMEESVARYRIKPGQLTIHQDRGAPMIAHRFIDQMYELDIILSHSRPRVSNDNAFSESQFKTLKYQPDYPGRFRDAAQARAWAESYFDWYNFSHHHSGLAGFTPAQVFTGDYRDLAAQRQRVLDGYHRANPERFVSGRPAVKLPSQAVYINQVTEEEVAAGATTAVNFPTLNRVKEKNELTLH